MDCETILQSSSVPLAANCDILPNGSLRLLTPFHYPNGSSIDLFVEEREPLLNSPVLSDLGQTISYLLDLQVKPWATKKRRQVVDDICRLHQVEWSGGRFQIPLHDLPPSEIPSAMVRLAQACIRVSDLAFHARLWTASSFNEEMEEFLTALDVSYETDVIQLGRGGQEVKVDFRISGHSRVSLVQTLSAANKSSASTSAGKAFLNWYDLESASPGFQPITVVDESNDVFRQGDLDRLARLSSVLWFPAEQEQLSEMLTL